MVQVGDPEALERALAQLFADENRRAELGRNALSRSSLKTSARWTARWR